MKTHQENLSVRHLSDTHLLPSLCCGCSPARVSGGRSSKHLAPPSAGAAGLASCQVTPVRWPQGRPVSGPAQILPPAPMTGVLSPAQGLDGPPAVWPCPSRGCRAFRRSLSQRAAPPHAREAGDRHRPGNAEPLVLERGRQGETRDRIGAAERTSADKAQGEEGPGKQRKRQKKRNSGNFRGERIWDVREESCVRCSGVGTPRRARPLGTRSGPGHCARA